MARSLLNLSALRRRVESDPDTDATAARSVEEPDPPADTAATVDAPRGAITRRRMVGSVAVVTAATAPLMRALGATVSEPFELRTGRNYAGFFIGRRARWIIDAKRFGGRARVEVRDEKNRIVVSLRDATWPGTSLPADMTCELRDGVSGWSMDLRMRGGRLRMKVPFERWLLGRAEAATLVSAPIGAALGAAGDLQIEPRARARFFPDWTLRFETDRGDGVGRVRLEGRHDVRAGALIVTLPDASDPTLMRQSVARRTIVRAERGNGTWPAEAILGDVGTIRLETIAQPFDVLDIESGESRKGAVSAAIAMEGADEAATVVARPCTGFTGATAGAGMPLREVRFATAFNGTHVERAVIARHDRRPVWLHARGWSALLGEDADDPDHRFEVVTRDDRPHAVVIEPRVLATHIALPDALTQPVETTEPRRLRFHLEGTVGRRERDSTYVELAELAPDDPPIRAILTGPAVDVVRADDLVTLRFEFHNMTIQGAGPARHVTAGGGTGTMVVHFPPQHITEQAFFQVADEAKSPATFDSSNPNDNPTGEEDPTIGPVLPVASRIAGTSRLAFRVPASTSPIEFTLEGLLRAMSQLEMNVVATALPTEKIISHRADIDQVLAQVPARAIARIGVNNSQVPIKEPTIGRAGPVELKSSMTRRGLTTRMHLNESTIRQPVGTSSISSTVDWSMDDVEISAISESEIGDIRNKFQLKPQLQKPSDIQTAIELPYRLLVSPNGHGAWAHALKPITRNGWTELWHTRLGVRGSDDSNESEGADLVDERSQLYRTIRAVWATGPRFSTDWQASVPHYDSTKPASEAEPFRMSLDEFDRHNVVHLSANFRIARKTGGDYIPAAVSVNRMMLTSLGGWLDSRGAWTLTGIDPLSVEEWRHRATMGRDHYVRVVYKGYLFPLGHRASLVKVTERKFHQTKYGPIAYLRQRMYIVVREPERTYRTSAMVVNAGGKVVNGTNGASVDAQCPLVRARLTTLVTPNLNDPSLSQLAGFGQSAFWPRVGSGDFLFNVVAEDLVGDEQEFSMPLVFVENSKAHDTAPMTSIRDEYDSETGTKNNTTRHSVAMRGQKIAFAEPEKLGDTSYETDELVFSAAIPEQSASLPNDLPRFFPVMRRARMLVPAIKHLVGNNGNAVFTYNQTFLKVGFKSSGSVKNPGAVFLDLLAEKSAPIGLDFNGKGDKSGGLAKPNMNITALSRAMGPVGGEPDEAVAGQMDPAKFFGGLNAKLFGVIDLWDILQMLGMGEAPKFVTEAVDAVTAFVEQLNAFLDLVNSSLSAVTEIATAVNGIKTVIPHIVGTSIPGILDDMGAGLESDLNELVTHLQTLETKLPVQTDVASSVLKDVSAKISSIRKDLQNVETFVSTFLSALQIPKELKVKLVWAPKIKQWPDSKPLFIPHQVDSLRLQAEVRAQSNFKKEPEFDVSCGLYNFTIDLIGPAESFILLHFEKIEFFVRAGSKPDIDVKMKEVEFVGVLSFVEKIKDLIPLDGFSDPPAIDVTASGIHGHFSIALPDVAVGVFSLQNMSLNAGFTVPFIGDPLSVNFSFCTRESPFLLTVSMFGGGGFFGITIDPGGVQLLEASFEFGASLSVNLGVASGGAEIMAGIYFRMEGDDASLTGYFRLGGHLSILAIISMSIEIRLELEYQFSSGKCVGRATITVEIEVLFFSASVEVTCERKFAGSNGDPTFAELMQPYTPDEQSKIAALAPGLDIDAFPWKDYCQAFA